MKPSRLKVEQCEGKVEQSLFMLEPLELRKVGFMGYSRLYRFKKLKALNFQCVLVMRFYRGLRYEKHFQSC